MFSIPAWELPHIQTRDSWGDHVVGHAQSIRYLKIFFCKDRLPKVNPENHAAPCDHVCGLQSKLTGMCLAQEATEVESKDHHADHQGCTMEASLQPWPDKPSPLALACTELPHGAGFWGYSLWRGATSLQFVPKTILPHPPHQASILKRYSQKEQYSFFLGDLITCILGLSQICGDFTV